MYELWKFCHHARGICLDLGKLRFVSRGDNVRWMLAPDAMHRRGPALPEHPFFPVPAPRRQARRHVQILESEHGLHDLDAIVTTIGRTTYSRKPTRAGFSVRKPADRAIMRGVALPEVSMPPARHRLPPAMECAGGWVKR